LVRNTDQNIAGSSGIELPILFAGIESIDTFVSIDDFDTFSIVSPITIVYEVVAVPLLPLGKSSNELVFNSDAKGFLYIFSDLIETEKRQLAVESLKQLLLFR
jgi:hypothetical protein